NPVSTTRDTICFPTRRSSDLTRLTRRRRIESKGKQHEQRLRQLFAARRVLAADSGHAKLHAPLRMRLCLPGHQRQPGRLRSVKRSEEHTSELQSRVDLVCRLL